MKLGKQTLRLRQTSLRDRRNQQELWVWGDLPAWMAVDEELADFLKNFNGQRTVRDVLRLHAKSWNKPLKTVREEAEPIIENLIKRRILGERVNKNVPEVEEISIANLTFNITNRCNLHCPWCYNDDRTKTEIPVKLLFSEIAKNHELFDEQATFIILGGEPFLVPDRLIATIEKAEELFSKPILVSTNGTLVTDDIIHKLTSRRVEVQVSIDSPIAKIHDAARGVGVHAKAINAVKQLVEAGIHTIISMVYTRDNIDQLEAYLDMALDLGVNEARFIPLRNLGGGLDFQKISPDQAITFDLLLDILDRRPEFKKLLARDYFSILATVLKSSNARTGCGVGRQVLFIDADGAVYPCTNIVYDHTRLGDIDKTSITEMVHESAIMKTFRKQYHVANYSRCSTCAFSYWCAGDCRGEILALTNNPFAPSPHCKELQKVMQKMLWLLADNDYRL